MKKEIYIHKKICLCRKCGGTGIETYYNITDLLNKMPLERTCSQCNGTGRVVVYGERILNIEPYEPKSTDNSTTGTV